MCDHCRCVEWCAAHLEPGLSAEQDGEGDGGGRHGVGGGQSVLYIHARLQLDNRGRWRSGQLQQVLHQLSDVHHHLGGGRSPRLSTDPNFEPSRLLKSIPQIQQRCKKLNTENGDHGTMLIGRGTRSRYQLHHDFPARLGRKDGELLWETLQSNILKSAVRQVRVGHPRMRW